MRYFLNTSAAKPVVAGGITFAFEPVGLWGGSWLGILAVADDAAASVLAGFHAPNVEEIPFDKYDAIKKKLTSGAGITSNSPIPPSPHPSPSLAIADRAGLPTVPITGSPAPKQNSTEMVTPVTLLTSRNPPPSESLLAPGSFMKRPK